MYGLLNFAIVVVSIILVCCAWLILKFLKASEKWELWEGEDMLGVLLDKQNKGDL
jgi:Mn2+/Fe2+ NRAMP family transporter